MVDTTTTTTTPLPISLGQLPLDVNVSTGRPLSIRAIDNHNELSQFFNIEDQKKIKEKFAPFIPPLRPWLVIVEVNMTNEKLNTECTGKNILTDQWIRFHF